MRIRRIPRSDRLIYNRGIATRVVAGPEEPYNARPKTVSGTRGIAGRAAPGKEEGSLIVLISILMIVVLLGVGFLANVFGDMSNSLQVTNTEAARAQALAGVSDAVFRLDQMGPDYHSFCVGQESWCTVPSVPAAPNANYVARIESSSPGVFTIYSKGVSHGAEYVVKATAQRKLDYPFPIFGVSSVAMNGKSGSVNVQATDQYGQPTGAPADLGSDSGITCHGSGSYGTAQITFDGGTSNCPSWVNGTSQYDPQPPVQSCPAPAGGFPPTPCMPSDYQSCPGNGLFEGTKASPYILEPGVYYCPNGVDFKGTVNVDYSSTANNGEVQIFVLPPSSGQASILMAGATVNQWEVPPSQSSKPVVGNPVDLQVYAGGSGTVNVGNGSNAASFNGLLYAPGMSLTVNGGQLSLTGAFTLNQFTVNGSPNLQVHYDARVETLGASGWTSADVIEVSPSMFSLALG
ncbi:MAG: DUF7305 domain-containing protein [Acidimicrobiales bacterium]